MPFQDIIRQHAAPKAVEAGQEFYQHYILTPGDILTDRQHGHRSDWNISAPSSRLYRQVIRMSLTIGAMTE